MKEKKIWKYGKILLKGIGLCLHLFMPVLSYFLFEYVTGNLSSISRPYAVLSILWLAVLYLAAFGLLGSSRLSVPLVSGILLLLSVAETFVMEFRGNPIMVWDILSFQTAMTVAENYVFTFSMEMKTAGIILLNINYLLMFFPIRARGWKMRLGAGIGSFGLCGVYVAVFFQQIIPTWALGLNMWAMEASFDEYGYILATAVSLQYTVKKTPRGYSHARLQKMAEEIQKGEYFGADTMEEYRENADLRESTDSIQPVNLICIMNESLSDLQVAGEFTTNKDYFPFIHGLTENTVKGSLCVPVFGAMTSNSEFEFLTGDSMALFPANTIAYQFYVQPETKSLVSTLKDQGFRAVAMHPYPPENWNRDKCYDHMGFDEFLSWDDYEGSGFLRYYISDSSNYDKIIEQVEKKDHAQDKLFIFNVTMQNHGGYDEVNESFPHEIYLTGENRGKYPKTDQYLSLMLESDRALEKLIAYFAPLEEPTMIVMFGDHQPSVEDEFYDAIAGQPSWEEEASEHLMWYQTPFLIWTNYSQPSQDMGKLGAIYLSSCLLERANLAMTPYQQFLLQLSKSLPVIHPIGCYGQDGTYYSWSEAESDSCPFSQLVFDYESMVYNHSLDNQKVGALFSLPQSAD